MSPLLRLDDVDAFFRLDGIDSNRVLAALRRLKAVHETPDFAARRLFGIAFLNLKDFVAAEEEFRAALRLRPDDRGLSGPLEELARRRAEIEAAREAEVRPRKIVLTVDDSPTIRKLVSLTLERRGYAVWTAADASVAIDLLREKGRPT